MKNPLSLCKKLISKIFYRIWKLSRVANIYSKVLNFKWNLIWKRKPDCRNYFKEKKKIQGKKIRVKVLREQYSWIEGWKRSLETNATSE